MSNLSDITLIAADWGTSNLRIWGIDRRGQVIDTINNALPQTLKDKQLKVHHSNLCTEITLPTNELTRLFTTFTICHYNTPTSC